MFSEAIKSYSAAKYQRALQSMPVLIHKRIEHGVSRAYGDLKLCLEYLYGTLPYTDAVTVPFVEMEREAAHSLRVFQENIWNQVIPEDIFFHFILCPRVNSETLEPCRDFFYAKVVERVRDLPLERAILEINLWCCEHVTYQASSDRTEGPMTAYRSGKGRCGEESVFAVTVFRSLGIPARQVYAPLWSHCDDNHAWVEVYVNGEWKFLGACEPEPILDHGWFVRAASRAMLIHTRAFSDYIGPGLKKETLIERRAGAYLYNETHRYAVTREITFTVQNEDGTPAMGALLRLQVLNMAAFQTIAVLKADRHGKVSIACGCGSLHIEAAFESRLAIADIPPGGDIHVKLVLKGLREAYVGFREFLAPKADVKIKTADSINGAQQRHNRERIRTANILRANRLAGYFKDFCDQYAPSEDLEQVLKTACGNVAEIGRFMLWQPAERVYWAKRLLDTLEEKDLRDTSADVLNHHLDHALRFLPLYQGNEPVYVHYLLSPRIGIELIRPWRAALAETLTSAEREFFAAHPQMLAKTIVSEANSGRGREWYAITGLAPGNDNALFVALARAIGLCARLNPVTVRAEFFGPQEDWVLAWPDLPYASSATLARAPEAPFTWSYGINWSLSRLTGTAFELQRFNGLILNEYDEIKLAPGTYRLVAVNRLPNGNQLADVQEVCLDPCDRIECNINMPKARLDDMLQKNALQDFSLVMKDGSRLTASSLCGEGLTAMLAFLQPGSEPTEHFLNELRESGLVFERSIELALIIRDWSELDDPTLKRFLSVYPNARVFRDSFEENLNMLARDMFLDPDSLPVVLLAVPPLTGVYGYCGYTVGGVDMAIKLSRLIIDGQ